MLDMKNTAQFCHWDAEDIRTYFDRYPNMTLFRLSQMTGRDIAEIKAILMHEKEK